MHLRALLKNRLVTIKYYSNGCLLVFKGSISALNLTEQTLTMKGESGQIRAFEFSDIIDIY